MDARFIDNAVLREGDNKSLQLSPWRPPERVNAVWQFRVALD
jgi:hypothetical protein